MGSRPEGVLHEALVRDFVSVERWHAEFVAMGKALGGGSGWVLLTLNPSGKLAEWKVVADADAPSKLNVLTITRINDTSGSMFNVCRTRDVVFQDGEIEVKIRANTGEEDQGGGVIWRVRDVNNYYIVRYNPLESNFRLYYVKNGDRRQLASACGIDIKAGK